MRLRTSILMAIILSWSTLFASAGTIIQYSPPSGEFLNPEITGQAVPEPSSVILAGVGMILIGFVSPRKRARACLRASCPKQNAKRKAGRRLRN